MSDVKKQLQKWTPSSRDLKIAMTISLFSSILTLLLTFTQGHRAEAVLLVLAGKFAAAAESPVVVDQPKPPPPVLLDVKVVKPKPTPVRRK